MPARTRLESPRHRAAPRSFALALALASADLLACGGAPREPQNEAARVPDPCANGPELAAVPLPATYAIAAGDQRLAELILPAAGPPELVAVEGAPAAAAAELEALVEAAAAGPSVEFTWTKETRQGETHGCAREVSKTAPEYVDALARHLEGKRIEAGILHLELK